MKWHHDLQTAGLYFQKIEIFHSLANGTATDLLDYSNAMIRIDDFIAYMEAAIAVQHEKSPTKHRRENEEQHIFSLPESGIKGNQGDAGSGSVDQILCSH